MNETLYLSDQEFKRRWDAVKGGYRSAWRTGDERAEGRAVFVMSWDVGCPLTKALLTEKLMELEGTGRRDLPDPRELPIMASRFNEAWPRLPADVKGSLLGKLAKWRRELGGAGGPGWRDLVRHVACLRRACVHPEGMSRRERPFLLTSRGERDSLRARLEREPWKEWYRLVCKISDFWVAGRDGSEDEELRLRFPRFGNIRDHLPLAWSCAALRYWVEGLREHGLKAREALLGMNDWERFSSFDFYECSDQHWTADVEAVAYDLTADLFSPEERRSMEQAFCVRAGTYLDHLEYPIGWRYNGGGAAMLSLAVGWDEGAEEAARRLRESYFPHLFGDGDPCHFWGYCSTVHVTMGAFLNAYLRTFGRSPLGESLGLVERHFRHYVRVCSPLGCSPNYGDTGNFDAHIASYFWYMNLLLSPARAEMMWLWERSGDPRVVHVRAPDRKRLAGEVVPCCPQNWTPMTDQPDPGQRERRFPVAEARLVPAILAFREFPKAQAPEADSYYAEKSGVAVLRTGREPDDLHLGIYTQRGPFSLRIHGERDIMSFELSAYGSPVVVHPDYNGIAHAAARKDNRLAVQSPPAPCTEWSAFNGKPLAWRCGVWSHSLAAIGPDGGLDTGDGWFFRPVQSADPAVDGLVVNSGDGFFGESDPRGQFRRVILLVKVDPPDRRDQPTPKGYFVLVDDVLTTRADAESHWLIQPRGSKVDGDGDTRIWTSYDFLNIPPSPVRLLVHWVRPPDSKVEMKMGIWIPFGDPEGEERPFPDIQWKGPGRMITVLYPLADGMEAPKIEDLPNRRGLKVGGDTIEADAEKVTFTRGGKALDVEMKPPSGK